MALSTGQVEAVLRKAGIDTGRTQEFTGRQGLSGTAGQDILFQELTGGAGGFAGEELIHGQRAEQAALLERQKAEEQGLLGRFTGKIEGFEPLSEMSKRISAELGIPELSEERLQYHDIITDLQGTLESLGERVGAETRGFDVTASQLGRIKEEREIPLRTQLTSASREAGKVGERLSERFGTLGTELGFAQQERALALKPFELEANLLSDRLAREFTGYSQQMQNELDLYLDQVQAGRQLAENEARRMHELAMAEEEFVREKELIKYTTDESIRETLATRKATAGEKAEGVKRKLLDDASAGATLSDLQRKYGDRLDSGEIVELYTGAEFYGEPEQQYAKEMLGLFEFGEEGEEEDRGAFTGK
jgi:hypothetical protein